MRVGRYRTALAAVAGALLCLSLSGEARAESYGQSLTPTDTENAGATTSEDAPPAPAASPEAYTSDDDLSASIIIVETLVGGITGLTGALAGGLLGVGVDKIRGSDGCDDDGFTICPSVGEGGLIGGIAGYTAGAAFGVYVVGTRGDRDASLLATMGGSLLGVVGGVGLASITDSDGLATTLVFTGPVIGALVGLHLTSSRSPRSSPSVIGNLIQIDKGEAHLGLPMIRLVPMPQSEGHSAIVQLVGGRL